MSDLDPAAHRMVDRQRWFEDFVLGERFVIPSRTMTSAVFTAFQAASDDTHPVCRAARLDENRHAGLSRTPSTASLARLLIGPVLAGESGHSIG
jgi:hypothetical protein